MGKLIFGLGVAAGGAATALALSEGSRDRVRRWLRGRSEELNGNPFEETRETIDRFGATARSYASDAMDNLSPTLEGKALEAKRA